MELNIVSISRMAAVGYAAVFRTNFLQIYSPAKTQVGQIYVMTNGLYHVDHGEVIATACEKITTLTLHRQMGHIAPDVAKRLVAKGIVEDVELVGDLELKSCSSCKYAKMTWKDIRKEHEEHFTHADSDYSVFYLWTTTHLLILAIHVDDCTMTGSSHPLMDEYKSRLHAKYALTDLEPISWLLGFEVKRDRAQRTIALSQRNYINSIIAHFKLADVKLLSILMDPNISYSKDQCPTSPQEVERMKR